MKRALLFLFLAGCAPSREHAPCPSSDGGFVEWGEPVLTGPCDAAFWEAWAPHNCTVTDEPLGCGVRRLSECTMADGSPTRLTEEPTRLFYEAGECTQMRTR